jgi:hypothetical protein
MDLVLPACNTSQLHQVYQLALNETFRVSDVIMLALCALPDQPFDDTVTSPTLLLIK